jgi:hypothetical protein
VEGEHVDLGRVVLVGGSDHEVAAHLRAHRLRLRRRESLEAVDLRQHRLEVGDLVGRRQPHRRARRQKRGRPHPLRCTGVVGDAGRGEGAHLRRAVAEEERGGGATRRVVGELWLLLDEGDVEAGGSELEGGGDPCDPPADYDRVRHQRP